MAYVGGHGRSRMQSNKVGDDRPKLRRDDDATTTRRRRRKLDVPRSR